MSEFTDITQPQSIVWETPVPLAHSRTVPPFPLGALPEFVASYVAEVAEETQTPPDLAGCMALAVASAATCGRVRAMPKRGWQEPVNLYVVVGLPPANRKSAVFDRLVRPLHDTENALRLESQADVIEGNAKARAAKIRLQKVERQFNKLEQAGHDGEPVSFKDLVDAMTEEEQARRAAKSPPRLVAADATPEALAQLMDIQDGRIAILSAEGGLLLSLTGMRYGDQPHLDLILQGHAGDRVTIDRKGRDGDGDYTIIERPAITLGLAVQPVVIADLGKMPVLRQRGLVARFLYSLPADTLGHRRWDVAPVGVGTEARWSDAIGTMAKRFYAQYGDPTVLPFCPAASAVVAAFADEVEPKLAPSGELRAVADWAGKLVGAAVRLATLHHLLSSAPVGPAVTEPIAWGPVSEQSAAAGVSLARYFVDHSLAALDLMSITPATENARHILAWAGSSRTTHATVRDVHRAVRSRIQTADEVRAALTLLVHHGYAVVGAPDASGPKGGRPSSPTVHFNPAPQRVGDN